MNQNSFEQDGSHGISERISASGVSAPAETRMGAARLDISHPLSTLGYQNVHHPMVDLTNPPCI